MKRSTNPLAMMGCLGLMAVVLFGGGVWWMSDKPIIRLRPELEKLYATRGFRCSLHIQEGRMDVELPSKLELDRFAKRRAAAEAFTRYLRLTKGNTQISAVQVITPPPETVMRDQLERFALLDARADDIVTSATTAGAKVVGKPLIAPGYVGPVVVLDIECDDATVKKVGSAVLRVGDVAFLQIRRDGKVVQESGVDAKLYGSATVAPVGSPAR